MGRIPHKLPVYKDFLDAGGKLKRFSEGGAVEYRFGIEEREVGYGALAVIYLGVACGTGWVLRRLARAPLELPAESQAA